MSAPGVEFSIIIPFKRVDGYVRECVRHVSQLDSDSYEVILLPDGNIGEEFMGATVYPTGPVKPSMKRNLGASKSRGKYLAFIDSDAYPEKGWLQTASLYLKDSSTGIVGGPNLQPENDTLMQKAGGDVLSSPLGSGAFSIRYSVKKEKKEVDELPSCNIFIARELFDRIGGYDTSLLTAEDAKLCFQTRGLGKNVVYTPDLIVYHHRRPLFRPHLKQIWTYGRDKARVLDLLPGKRRITYLLPSLFVIFLLLGFIAQYAVGDMLMIRTMYFSAIVLYLILISASSIYLSPRRFFLVIPGIVLTHLAYGIGFIRGAIRKQGPTP
jgi:cellulose synthase/poly-beta-1,6-N-acetylglucosamine synthase-like glycosyltransferase